MALSGETNKQTFSPSAGTTSLSFGLPFFDAVLAGDSGTTKKFGDIKVARETSAGVITQLTPTSGVVGADEFKIAATNGDTEQGCTVTIASSTAGDKYTVERDVAYTQEYDLQEGATIDPTALNKALDRVVAQNQQQNDEFSRTITFPVTDADSITYNVDSSATDRAGKVLGFDSSGNVTELAQIQGSASVDTSRGLQLVNNQVGVKDDGITNQFIADNAVDTAQIANDAVEQAKIANNAVGTTQVANSAITKAKMEDVNNMRVLGNTSGSTTAPQEVSVLAENNMVSDSPTALATQQSIKAYVDLYKPNLVRTVVDERSSLNASGFKDLTTATQALEVTITPKFGDSDFKINCEVGAGNYNPMHVVLRVQYKINNGSYQNFDISSEAQSADTSKFHMQHASPYDTPSEMEVIPFSAFLADASYSTGDTLTFKVQGFYDTIDRFYFNRTENGGDFPRSRSFIEVQEIYQ